MIILTVSLGDFLAISGEEIGKLELIGVEHSKKRSLHENVPYTIIKFEAAVRKVFLETLPAGTIAVVSTVKTVRETAPSLLHGTDQYVSYQGTAVVRKQ